MIARGLSLLYDEFSDGDLVFFEDLDEIYACAEFGEVEFTTYNGRFKDRGSKHVVNPYFFGSIGCGYDADLAFRYGIRIQFEALDISTPRSLLRRCGTKEEKKK